MGNSFIWLKTDDDTTLAKKFRVIGGPDGDYDDGTLSKTQTINKTIGGGLDVSSGEIYRTWSPTIMVRHTESETDYGNLADLEQFYLYNNPGGTPSDRLHFTDHHGTVYTILLIGDLRKQVLGVAIEGADALYYVRIQLHEVK